MSSSTEHHDPAVDHDPTEDRTGGAFTTGPEHVDTLPPPPAAAAAWPRDDVDVDVEPAPTDADEPAGYDRPAVEADESAAFSGSDEQQEPVVYPEVDETVEPDPSRIDEPEPLTAVAVDEDRTDDRTDDRPVDEDGTLIGDPADVRQRWQSVQVGFVDDPRGAIDDAGKLVDEVVELVVSGVSAQRDRLGESWSADDLDTEQLRQALRRYREFLDRLLAV